MVSVTVTFFNDGVYENRINIDSSIRIVFWNVNYHLDMHNTVQHIQDFNMYQETWRKCATYILYYKTSSLLPLVILMLFKGCDCVSHTLQWCEISVVMVCLILAWYIKSRSSHLSSAHWNAQPLSTGNRGRFLRVRQETWAALTSCFSTDGQSDSDAQPSWEKEL